MVQKTKQSFIKFLWSWVLVLLVATLLPSTLHAATLGIQPSTTSVKQGGSFSARVYVNTQDKAMNNAEAVITFPTDLLEVTSVSSSGSISTLWVESPTFSNSAGTISFNGGVPNPGYTGASGLLVTIQFKAKASGTATLGFASAAVRENDGLGTNILAGQSGASISITADTQTEPTTEQPTTPSTPTNALNLRSSSHPDPNVWYNNNKAVFNWNLPSGTQATQTSLDTNPNGSPTVVRRPAASSVTVDNVKDGIHYFHLRYQQNGQWSAVNTIKILVDTTAPSNVTAQATLSADGLPVLNMSADDNYAGIDYFTVTSANNQEEKVVAQENKGVLNLINYQPGQTTFVVTAVDRAGLKISKEITTDIPIIKKIVITDYSSQITDGQPITITGLVPSGNGNAQVFLQPADGLTRTYTVPVNNNRQFSFTSEPIATSGNYTAWVEFTTTETGLLKSDTIIIRIKSSVFSGARSFFNTIADTFTPTNIIIFVLAILAITGWTKYFRLKRRGQAKISQLLEPTKPAKPKTKRSPKT